VTVDWEAGCRANERGTVLPVRGRPQEEGNLDARAGGGRGAKGTNDGRVSATPPFPCRDGKLREKIFSDSRRIEKSLFDQYPARDPLPESKARQGNGRETRESSDRLLVSTDQCYHVHQ